MSECDQKKDEIIVMGLCEWRYVLIEKMRTSRNLIWVSSERVEILCNICAFIGYAHVLPTLSSFAHSIWLSYLDWLNFIRQIVHCFVSHIDMRLMWSGIYLWPVTDLGETILMRWAKCNSHNVDQSAIVYQCTNVIMCDKFDDSMMIWFSHIFLQCFECVSVIVG